MRAIFLLAFFAACGSFYYPHRMETKDMPAKFAVPLLPWVPCLGLFTNIFLISSLGVNAYIRFVVWFLIGLAIYFFYGESRAARAARAHVRRAD